MDDRLALELGTIMYGGFPGTFINADGIKKSISAPGPGNFLCFSRAVSSALNLVGNDVIKKNSFIHAHGSSTPANRVTESDVLDRTAQAFNIFDWPVTAIKSYVGHSMAAASGDQVISALGTFSYQIIQLIDNEQLYHFFHDKLLLGRHYY